MRAPPTKAAARLVLRWEDDTAPARVSLAPKTLRQQRQPLAQAPMTCKKS
jgi:hypothetical protein